MSSSTSPAPLSANDRGRRDKVSLEEIAAACDALVADNHKVTIAAVRQRVGGGGNQTVMDGVGRWRDRRRKSEQAGQFEGFLSDPFRTGLVEEIQRHRRIAQSETLEQVRELEDIGDVLREELAAISSRAEALEAGLEEKTQSCAAAMQRAEEADSIMAARQADAQAQRAELDRRVSQQADKLEGERLQAAQARLSAEGAHGRLRQAEEELAEARTALAQVRRQSHQDAQQAAVLDAQQAGHKELVEALRGRLESLSAQREAAEQRLSEMRETLLGQRRSLRRARARAERFRAHWRAARSQLQAQRPDTLSSASSDASPDRAEVDDVQTLKSQLDSPCRAQ